MAAPGTRRGPAPRGPPAAPPPSSPPVPPAAGRPPPGPPAPPTPSCARSTPANPRNRTACTTPSAAAASSAQIHRHPGSGPELQLVLRQIHVHQNRRPASFPAFHPGHRHPFRRKRQRRPAAVHDRQAVAGLRPRLRQQPRPPRPNEKILQSRRAAPPEDRVIPAQKRRDHPLDLRLATQRPPRVHPRHPHPAPFESRVQPPPELLPQHPAVPVDRHHPRPRQPRRQRVESEFDGSPGPADGWGEARTPPEPERTRGWEPEVGSCDERRSCDGAAPPSPDSGPATSPRLVVSSSRRPAVPPSLFDPSRAAPRCPVPVSRPAPILASRTTRTPKARRRAGSKGAEVNELAADAPRRSPRISLRVICMSCVVRPARSITRTGDVERGSWLGGPHSLLDRRFLPDSLPPIGRPKTHPAEPSTDAHTSRPARRRRTPTKP